MRVIRTLYLRKEGSLEWSMQLTCKVNTHMHVDESQIKIWRTNTKGGTLLFNSPLSLVICPFLMAGTTLSWWTDVPFFWQDPQARSWRYILLNVLDIMFRQWVTLGCQILNAETGDGPRKINWYVYSMRCGRPAVQVTLWLHARTEGRWI